MCLAHLSLDDHLLLFLSVSIGRLSGEGKELTIAFGHKHYLLSGKIVHMIGYILSPLLLPR